MNTSARTRAPGDPRRCQPYAHAAWDPRLTRLHANENPWRDAADPSRGRAEPLSRTAAADAGRRAGRALRRRARAGAGRPRQRRGHRSAGARLLPRRARTASWSARRPSACTASPRRSRAPGSSRCRCMPRSASRSTPDAVLDAWTPAAKIVFLCSPNNPTGNLLDRRRAVDCACSTASPDAHWWSSTRPISSSPRRPVSLPWLAAHPNLAILRTLSKAYGLAGARCGALHRASPEVIGLLAADDPALRRHRADDRGGHSRRSRPRSSPSAAPDASPGLSRGARPPARRRLQPLAAVLRVWPSDSQFPAGRVPDAGRCWRRPCARACCSATSRASRGSAIACASPSARRSRTTA